MSAEVESLIKNINETLRLLRRHLDWDFAVSRLEELNALCENPDLWLDPDKAQKLMQERTYLEHSISSIKEIERLTAECAELIAMAEEEDDEALASETLKDLQNIQKTADRKRLESLLSGEADKNDAYLQVNAGAGGTEAQDWAEMVLRMYMRWADKRGFKYTTLERSDGEEAGIKSTTLKLEGYQAYGWLKMESGVHRLVRISPFDSNARRHTSFASVSVSPVLDETIHIEIAEKDLRIDTYRSSGAGGQHVNKTDSAVRITHIPTGVVAACQNGRSQHQNRATAMEMLKAKLYEMELQKREQEKMKEHGEKTEIGWGHQIRSYVLHPYQMVKDLRTNFETTQSQSVLDGDIDAFLEASLAALA
ncbi:MAG: peptide chain release factor 2 [Alphaproteobacteria bacterium]|nr:peptide chain release factor 2 [Alphaproteobacteria bacterium]